MWKGSFREDSIEIKGKYVRHYARVALNVSGHLSYCINR